MVSVIFAGFERYRFFFLFIIYILDSYFTKIMHLFIKFVYRTVDMTLDLFEFTQIWGIFPHFCPKLGPNPIFIFFTNYIFEKLSYYGSWFFLLNEKILNQSKVIVTLVNPYTHFADFRTPHLNSCEYSSRI